MTLAAVLLAMGAGYAVIPASPSSRWRTLQRTHRAPRRVSLPLAASLLAPVLGFALAGGWGLVLGTVAAPAVARAVRHLEPAAQRRERQLVVEQLPLAVDLLAAAVASGVPVHRAIAVVAEAMPPPVGPQLTAVARRLAVSGEAVGAWTDDGPLAPLARALRRAALSGVPIVAVLDDTARELHRDRRAARRDAARRVAVRTAAPLGVCFLPAFFLVGIVPALIGAFSTLSW